MPDSELTTLSATALAARIRRRDVSSEQVVRAHLDRLRAIHPLLNTVLQIAPESAIEQAREADHLLARGVDIGPLHGVPFTVKDVFPIVDIARMVDMPGMAPRPDREYARDATAAARLRRAGAIPIAVTRATLWTDREERYGRVRNPYNPDFDASGSSGGEAATIAAGGSPLGIGSDSGGSLRDPANRCGIATLRPSNGRVPRGVDAAGANDPRTAAGPLARTVADVALAMSVIGGVDPYDPTTLPMSWPDYRAVDVRGLRVLAFDDNGLVSASPEDKAAVNSAALALEQAGCNITWSSPPWCDEAYEVTKQYWHYGGEEGEVREYFQFLDRRDGVRIRMSLFMQDIDLILCPVDPLTTLYDRDLPGFTYTTPFSLVGWPCAVVRASTASNGLPIGVQIVAGPWRDDVALAAAAVIEAAYGGMERVGDNMRRKA